MNFNEAVKKAKLVFISALFLFIIGCQSNIGSGTYESVQAGQAERTEPGVILSYRYVEVSEDGASSGGMILGAITGGVLGNMVGGGRGNTLATVGGALAGGAAGSAIGDNMGKQQGVEYTIEYSSGDIITIVQGPEPLLQVGSHVLVQYSAKGRGRVIMDPRY